MPDIFKHITSWLTTSGIKVVGILITLVILSPMSRWIVKWLGRFLATAGIGALAIGFGGQSLVKDVISGFFIILEPAQILGVERFSEPRRLFG